MYGPDISFSTPILTVGAPCARGRMSGSAAAAVAVPRRARRDMVMAEILPVESVMLAMEVSLVGTLSFARC